MSDLTRFQDAFTEALTGREAALATWLAGCGRAGLSVYRNTGAKAAIDAIAANFPTVERLVGEVWMRAAAGAFVLEHPPRMPALVAYGAGFPVWLAGFGPATDLPFLAPIARLDRSWTEAHLAADAEPLDPGVIAALDAVALASTAVVLHPSARVAGFEFNIPSLWLASRPPASAPDSFDLDAAGEGLLLVRPAIEVRARRLGAGDLAFVQACAAGRPLAQAAALALAEPQADLPAIVAACLEDGLFIGLKPAQESLP